MEVLVFLGCCFVLFLFWDGAKREQKYKDFEERIQW